MGKKDYFTKNVNAIIKCYVKNMMYSKTRLKQKARHERILFKYNCNLFLQKV